MDSSLLFAGHGGQGILFAAKVAAYAGLYSGMNVSWMPSYGPEMRGGTANCGVHISARPIGSPMVGHPSVLVAMNTPAYDRFVDSVAPGGLVLVDSTLVHCERVREDLRMTTVPATRLAREAELEGLASVLLLGRAASQSGFASWASLVKALEKCVPAHKNHLLEPNKQALRMGFDPEENGVCSAEQTTYSNASSPGGSRVESASGKTRRT